MPITLDDYLVSTPDTCGGRLRLAGTRLTVLQIASLYKEGRTPEDIAGQYPHVELAGVYAALSYYHANRAEVDRALDAERLETERLESEYLQLRRSA